MQTPLLFRRGGREINKSAAKPPLIERTGWSGMPSVFVARDHPVCGAKVGFAAINSQKPIFVISVFGIR